MTPTNPFIPIKGRHIPALRECKDKAQQAALEVAISQGVTLDAVINEWEPDDAEAALLRLWQYQAAEKASIAITETTDGWQVNGLGYDVFIPRPRQVGLFITDGLQGYAYERLIINRLTGLTPAEVDDMPLALYNAITTIIHTANPRLAAAGWL